MKSEVCNSVPQSSSEMGEEDLARLWLEAAVAGDFSAAWSASDQIGRAKIDSSGRERWQRSLWDGSPIGGQDVLLRCWRGLGDAIHFIRYASLIRAQAKSLSVEAPRALLGLLKMVDGIDNCYELDQEKFEEEQYVQIESTELPYLFRSTLETIPKSVPYIHLPPKSALSAPGTKIGLCWCGGTYDPRRAVALVDLQLLAGMPDLSFYQLQRGAALDEARGSSFEFFNPSDRSMDLYDTAILINSLDLIISVDTMVAHLAGALGKEVYLLLHTEADWRWMRERPDSPWYPTMTLLRQSHTGDWKTVVTQLREVLRKRVG